MKLEDIDDVLKQNVSKDCSVRLLAARILHCDDYTKLYESCRNYDEFEKRVLNKECPLNAIYSAISMYEKIEKIIGTEFVNYLGIVVLRQYRMQVVFLSVMKNFKCLFQTGMVMGLHVLQFLIRRILILILTLIMMLPLELCLI